jgi:hypothetical protein
LKESLAKNFVRQPFGWFRFPFRPASLSSSAFFFLWFGTKARQKTLYVSPSAGTVLSPALLPSHLQLFLFIFLYI